MVRSLYNNIKENSFLFSFGIFNRITGCSSLVVTVLRTHDSLPDIYLKAIQSDCFLYYMWRLRECESLQGYQKTYQKMLHTFRESAGYFL